MMENEASKEHVTGTEELILGNWAFLAGNGVIEGHKVSRKELIFMQQKFFDRE